MDMIRSEHGTVSEQQLTNDKSMAIVGITIASRSAIEAGLHSEVILSLTDSYIQEVVGASKSAEIETIVFHCNLHLARLVSEYHSAGGTVTDASGYYSGKAKDYIASRLHQKIGVPEIAESLGITPNYLSAVFMKAEGIGISAYILREKIRLSKNMLLYSELSVSDIAMYLNFSSQSHFSNSFKSYYGQTPLKFRKHIAANAGARKEPESVML